MITAQEKQYIVEQRVLGRSFVQIGEQLGRSGNSVRMIFERATAEPSPKTCVNKCRYCGKDVSQPSKGAMRRFCSDKCRFAWYNEQKRRVPYKLVCESCGQEFVSFGNPRKRFCCRQCATDFQRGTQNE